jgi:hypothetical protein
MDDDYVARRKRPPFPPRSLEALEKLLGHFKREKPNPPRPSDILMEGLAEELTAAELRDRWMLLYRDVYGPKERPHFDLPIEPDTMILGEMTVEKLKETPLYKKMYMRGYNMGVKDSKAWWAKHRVSGKPSAEPGPSSPPTAEPQPQRDTKPGPSQGSKRNRNRAARRQRNRRN